MRNIAEAFTTQDPDGNGVDDTYGLAVYERSLWQRLCGFDGLFNAYNAYPGIWVDKGG